jgi:hypothetical protein
VAVPTRPIIGTGSPPFIAREASPPVESSVPPRLLARVRTMRIPFGIDTARALQALDTKTAQHRAASQQPVGRGTLSNEHLCGDCHACCIHLPISANEVSTKAKPAGVKCPHLADHGCQVYSRRPSACRQFQCVWRMEPSWPLAWRPERSGLLCLREEIDNGVSAALVYEIEPGALTRPTTEPILAKLAESTAVVALVNDLGQRRLLCGQEWVDEASHSVRRPHFLRPIQSIQSNSLERLRDAS